MEVSSCLTHAVCRREDLLNQMFDSVSDLGCLRHTSHPPSPSLSLPRLSSSSSNCMSNQSSLSSRAQTLSCHSSTPNSFYFLYSAPPLQMISLFKSLPPSSHPVPLLSSSTLWTPLAVLPQQICLLRPLPGGTPSASSVSIYFSRSISVCACPSSR